MIGAVPPKLADIFAGMPTRVVAVSGGVDSLTLMTVAHALNPAGSIAAHAFSPAVPQAATARVQEAASAQGWNLQMVDAGELADENYRRNPLDRCFFCKTRLYDSLSVLAKNMPGAQIISGANMDDLADFRPGLDAARNFGVRHPFIEAGIGKASIRNLAAALGLHHYANLPASPCLSSRVETGIAITPSMLQAIDRIETLIRERTGEQVVRCRLRPFECTIELGTLHGGYEALRDRIATILGEYQLTRPIIFTHYQRGSAFIHDHENDPALTDVATGAA